MVKAVLDFKLFFDTDFFFLVAVRLFINNINLCDTACVKCDSLFLTDLSFMEEWPCRGKTLERHDGSSSHCRVPVARPQGLRNPATTLATVFCPLRIQHQPLSPCPQHISLNCSLALQIMCVISLFSGLFDILCPQSLGHHF